MPTSDHHQVSRVVAAAMKLRPKSVLDVGVGFGKYGVLLREYLEFWDGREDYRNWRYRIDGIEIFPDYITPVHSYVYDNVYIGNAAEIVPTLPIRYDLMLLVDVIEHFDKADGANFLDLAKQRARNILIATPRDIGTQAGAFGNTHETHRSQWARPDFPEAIEIDEGGRSLLLVIGDDADWFRADWRTRLAANWRTVYQTAQSARRFLRHLTPPSARDH